MLAGKISKDYSVALHWRDLFKVLQSITSDDKESEVLFPKSEIGKNQEVTKLWGAWGEGMQGRRATIWNEVLLVTGVCSTVDLSISGKHLGSGDWSVRPCLATG